MFFKTSQVSQENSCVGVSKDTSTQVFSCETCEIFQKTSSEEYLRTATSVPVTLENSFILQTTQPEIARSKLTIETLEQGVKYVRS